MMTFHKYIYIFPLLLTPIILFFPADFFSQTSLLVAAQVFILIGCTILFVITFILAYRRYEFARILFISINNSRIIEKGYTLFLLMSYIPSMTSIQRCNQNYKVFVHISHEKFFGSNCI